MIKALKRFIIGVLPIAIAGMFSLTAFAEEERVSVGDFSIKVPVEITAKYEGVEIPEHTYEVVITPVDGAPMPAVVGNPLKKSGVVEFKDFGFTIPDNYKYEIKLVTEDLDKLEVDKSSYEVTVIVTNEFGMPGDPLVAGMVVTKSDMLGKPEKISFGCEYTKEPSKKPSGGGGGGGGGSSTRRPSGDALIGDDGVPLAVLGAFEEDPIPLAVLPMTGDVTNMALWMLMFVISAFGLAGTLVARKKIS